MKQLKYAIVALLLLGGMSVHAQQRFDATVFGGITLNQIDGDDAGAYGHMGLRAGVGTSFYFGWDERTPWRMVVELAFSQKGSRISNNFLERTISLNYVEIPVMMSYTMLDRRLRLAAGVAPAVLVGARVNDAGARNEAVEGVFKNFDWCPVTLAARYIFTDNFAVEARFQTSLLSASEPTAGSAYRIFRDNKGCFNRMIALGLAYCF